RRLRRGAASVGRRAGPVVSAADRGVVPGLGRGVGRSEVDPGDGVAPDPERPDGDEKRRRESRQHEPAMPTDHRSKHTAALPEFQKAPRSVAPAVWGPAMGASARERAGSRPKKYRYAPTATSAPPAAKAIVLVGAIHWPCEAASSP